MTKEELNKIKNQTIEYLDFCICKIEYAGNKLQEKINTPWLENAKKNIDETFNFLKEKIKDIIKPPRPIKKIAEDILKYGYTSELKKELEESIKDQ
jgi:ferritin-like protein